MQQIEPARVLRAYRRYAPIYDWLFGAVLEPGRRALGRAVHALRPAALLEVGVGTGLMLPYYPEATMVTGVDMSEAMIHLARARAARLQSRRIALHLSNAEVMEFPDGVFDCVTLPYVMSVTPDPDRLCAEVRRVCRRGGTIFLLNHFSGGVGWRLLERLVRGATERIGFRSEFDYEEQVLGRDWSVRSSTPVNLGGLSRLVEIVNP